MEGGVHMGEFGSCAGGFFSNTAAILVLFILLVIITKTFLY